MKRQPVQMEKYQWANPYEWLEEMARSAWSLQRCKSELLALAAKLDSDQLQDEYQSEMEETGYFKEIGEDEDEDEEEA